MSDKIMVFGLYHKMMSQNNTYKNNISCCYEQSRIVNQLYYEQYTKSPERYNRSQPRK